MSSKIYPNPTHGQFFYELDNIENASLQIMDAGGKLVRNIDKLEHKGEINLSDYAKGVYFIRLTKDSSTSVQKLIIE